MRAWQSAPERAKSLAHWLICLVLVMATACSAKGAALPPSPTTVSEVMTEYRIDGVPRVPRGRVVFQVRNAGKVLHRLVLVTIRPEAPPMSELVKGPPGNFPVTIAETPSYRPGVAAGLAVDLSPGRYGFLCIIVDDDRILHYQKGMASEFRVE